MTELEQLWALRDGDLPEAEAARLRDRLATEPELQALWARVDQLALDLPELPLDAPPAGLNAALVDQEPPAPSASVDSGVRSGRWRVIGGMVVLAGAAAASSLLTQWWMAPLDAPLGPTMEEPVATVPVEVEPEVELSPPEDRPSVAAPREVDLLDTGMAPGDAMPGRPTRQAPAPAPVAAYEGLPQEFGTALVGIVGHALGPDATGERGYWVVGNPLPTHAMIGGDTVCGTEAELLESRRGGLSTAVRGCLAGVAASDAVGARRASFWLLGDLSGTPKWEAAAVRHLERWDEQVLAASLAHARMQRGEPDFTHYASLAFPYKGRSRASKRATTALYAGWREAEWRQDGGRIAWHEAVDAAGLWRVTDSAGAGQQALWGELVAATPPPSGCEQGMAGDLETRANCWLRVVEDDAYPASLRSWAAPQVVVVFSGQGDSDRQLRALRGHLDADPLNADVHLELAQLLAERQAFPEALAMLEQAEVLADPTAETRMLRRRLEDTVSGAPSTALTPAGPASVEVCSDLRALEPAAMMGRLNTSQRACLAARAEDAADPERRRVALVILQNLWSRGDRAEWTEAAQLELKRTWDLDIAYRLAVLLHRDGGQDPEVVALTERVLVDGLRWEGQTRTTRLAKTHKTRVAALRRLSLTDASVVSELQRSAEDWHAYAEKTGMDLDAALAACLEAGGSCR
ncbi:MAG: hypothetical protein KC912_06385 [Proteobacteria bacterium]|nr:hypothetical protein [Pseudomonadota bacterium]